MSEDNALEPGTPIEVQNRLDGRWSRGFEIASHGPDGYRIRRVSDNSELPAVFTEDQIRIAKKRHENNTWWF